MFKFLKEKLKSALSLFSRKVEEEVVDLDGRPRVVGDGGVAPGQAIEEGALADVRASDDQHRLGLRLRRGVHRAALRPGKPAKPGRCILHEPPYALRRPLAARRP